MTDGKIQPCRNGCGRNVYVSDRSGKWLPYNEGTDNKHDCPNYKKTQITYAGFKSGPTDNDRLLLDIAEKVTRIEELLEATLKNLGLFSTADDKKRLPPVNRTLGGDPLE